MHYQTLTSQASPNNVEVTGNELQVELSGVSRIFSDGTGLRETTLGIGQGEFVSILGPSGCGKSTLLRCIAGLETPDSGIISIGGVAVFSAEKRKNLSPAKRGLSMVFQDLALWPHMTVRQNVEFPLTTRGSRVTAQVRKQKVDQALELVGIAAKAEQRPQELSGGQQQRVAIARALVSEPKLLLMDEPLSALDAALREQIRADLSDLVYRLGLTVVYVTHDQAEALAMSDRVVVMNRGVVEQFDSPVMLYNQPASDFVADFVGTMNRHQSGAMLRPEHLHVLAPAGLNGQIAGHGDFYRGTVRTSQFVGDRYEIRADIEGATKPWLFYSSTSIDPGEEVHLGRRVSTVT